MNRQTPGACSKAWRLTSKHNIYKCFGTAWVQGQGVHVLLAFAVLSAPSTGNGGKTTQCMKTAMMINDAGETALQIRERLCTLVSCWPASFGNSASLTKCESSRRHKDAGAPCDMVGERAGRPMTVWGGKSPPPPPPPLEGAGASSFGAEASFGGSFLPPDCPGS